MWMACYTQAKIAAEESITKETVSEIVRQKTADLPKSDKPAANHLTDFDPPIYNVWKQQIKTGKVPNLTIGLPEEHHDHHGSGGQLPPDGGNHVTVLSQGWAWRRSCHSVGESSFSEIRL